MSIFEFVSTLIREIRFVPVVLGLAGISVAQPEVFESQPVVIEGTVLPQPELRIAASQLVQAEGQPWLRVRFGLVNLPQTEHGQAYLRLTSLFDGAEQVLTQAQLEQWNNHSAYFNGSEVLMEVVMPAGVSGHTMVSVAGVVVPGQADSLQTICGTVDVRTLVTHPAIGRVLPISCSAWILDSCGKCLVTAGHCTNGSANVVQFNVPPSRGDGTLVFPGPSDQYAVNASVTRSSGPREAGSEYGLLQVYPNPNTGLMPFERQGHAFTLASASAQINQLVSVTGFGSVDPSTGVGGQYNYALRTHMGPVVQVNTTRLEYQVDTTGGNSGSPVIDLVTGNAVGIHTHGGCTLTAGNRGSSVTLPTFQEAVSDPYGPCSCPEAALTVEQYPAEIMLPRHPATVVVKVARPNGSEAPLLVSGVELRAAINGGADQIIPMTKLSATRWSALLPTMGCGSVVRYSVRAVANDVALLWPADPTMPAWGVAGWQVLEHKSFNFEKDPNWAVTTAPGAQGAWGIGVPTNEPERLVPATDSDGSGKCWLTGPGSGDNDVDGGPVTFTTEWFSPPSESATIISYDRYFANDDRDDLLVIDLQKRNYPWVNIERIGTKPLWETVRHPARSAAEQATQFRLRFQTSDNPNNSITEAAIDAVKVEWVSCSIGCAADINGDGVVDFFDFIAWLDLVGLPWSRGDLNGDGQTDFLDLLIMLEAINMQCSPMPQVSFGQELEGTIGIAR